MDGLQGIDYTGILLDNIIVTGLTRKEQLQNLREVFKRPKQAGLHLKVAKCQLMQKSVNYLGHRIDLQRKRVMQGIKTCRCNGFCYHSTTHHMRQQTKH
ncbi:hypothetical protein J437_LFUL004521 [Ladona fulva]|uniref:Reverse transcriptase domain-containing protein n=1 Tax=Ladona fulva TaxID=123851 RepID=A0A8K0KAJ6_LADFU|nr:hypothetical protein J437_LFUL004521 [Ladona fulva]